MKKFACGLALGLCAAVFCLAPARAAETLRVGGGSAPMENIFKRIKEPFQKKTGITLELLEIGPVDAYTALLNGQIDVASAGMGSLRQWQDMVGKSGAGAVTRENLVWRIIGNDVITMYANKKIPVGQLTREQAKGIFTGKIANWREVGGPVAPIVVVLGDKIPVMMKDFRNEVLEGAAYVRTAEYAGDAEDMKKKVVGTPNSVSIGTAIQLADDRINAINYPAPKRYISMVWKFDSPKREQAQMLYEYLNSEEAREFTQQGSGR